MAPTDGWAARNPHARIRVVRVEGGTVVVTPVGRWARSLARWIHNEQTYGKPVAIKPALRGRRHGW